LATVVEGGALGDGPSTDLSRHTGANPKDLRQEVDRRFDTFKDDMEKRFEQADKRFEGPALDKPPGVTPVFPNLRHLDRDLCVDEGSFPATELHHEPAS
jgi:hypothetical protein